MGHEARRGSSSQHVGYTGGYGAGMKTSILTSALVISLATTAAAQSPDADMRRVNAILSQPATPSAGVFTGTPPRELFHEVGDDNVSSLLVHSDCDGDGVPEIVTGWDIFKSGDNLTVSSGAGFLPGQLVWGLETADGISGGYFSGQETLASYVDVTGDGVDEFIACTAGGGRAATVYDATNGAVVQSFNTYLGPDSGWVYDVAVVGDVNGNGTVDFAIAVGSNDDAVYMIDGGSTGTHHDEIWRHQGADVFYGVVVVGDINGDGVPDVVAGNGDNSGTAKALSGATGAVLWSKNQGATNWHMKAFPDLNGDGIAEVILGTWQADGVRMIDGATGTLRWRQAAGSTLVLRVTPTADVDLDGIPDVLVAGSSGGASLISGDLGTILWNRNVGSNVWAIDPITDVTGDGIDEVAFGDFNGLTRLVDGSDGSDLWSHSAGGHKVLSLSGAPDLDGDGTGEVIVGAQQLSSGSDKLLFVLDADSGLPSGGPELNPSGGLTLGSTLQLALSSATPGHTAFTVLGFDPALVPLGAKGTLAIDPGLFAILLSQVVPGSGALTTALPIPSDPTFDGLLVYLQTFVLTGAPASGASANRVGYRLEL
jgi:hypothetical protein